MVKRVLLIGATGIFGQRLASHLAKMPELHLILTSRSKDRAQVLVNRLISGGANATLESRAFDIGVNPDEAIAQSSPWLVIDASGPFQFMDYRVPMAALAAGSHFIDLADAQDYLIGFERSLERAAKNRGLIALAGASTTPALTSAVVDHLTQGWRRIDTVDITIVPSGANAVGPALVKAVLAQAGAPVATFALGRFTTVNGWLGSSRASIPRLGRFRVTPVETVDALTLTEKFKVALRVSFRAGLVSPIEQFSIEAFAWLRKKGLLKTTGWMVPLLVAGRNMTRRFCNDRGGMCIQVCGLNAQSRWTEANWSLLARDGHGPHVPTLAAVAAVRKLLAGNIEPGARMIAGELPLDAIEREYDGLSITSEIQFSYCDHGPFEGAVGRRAFHTLPVAVQAFHDVDGAPAWRGRSDVERGCGVMSRFIGWLMGLPSAGKSRDVEVSVERRADGSEKWTRIFSGRPFSSIMRLSEDGYLNERFGPAAFDLGLTASASGTALPVKRAWLFGLPLPRFLQPRSTAMEQCDEKGRFRFDVRLDLPVFGLLVHYRGWLEPAHCEEFV